MANKVNITAKWLQSIESPAKGRVWYSDENLSHFQVCVTHTGARIFYRVGRINGGMSRVRIGAHPDIPVKVARELCIQMNADVVAGKEINRTRRSTTGEKTLKEAYEWWLEYHAKPNNRTWERYQRVWNRDVASLGSRPLSGLKRADLIELIATTRAKYGPSAGNKIIELVRGVFTTAIENEWAVKNPASKIPKHKPEERERFLQVDEVPRFFAALKSFRPRIQDFFLLCLFTGARRSNVMAMRWDELNLDAWAWRVPRPKSKSKKPIIVPLVIPAIEILNRRALTAGDNPWVFPSSASKTGHYVEPKDAWRRIVTKAGLEDFTIHDLRRTLGSWQAGQGVSTTIIGKSLGHTPGSKATNIYARLANDPVLLAVMNATDAIEKAAARKISEKSQKSD